MSKRGWIVSVGVAALIGLGAVATLGVLQMNTANQEFQKLRESISPPDSWTLVNENTRLTGLFGSCFTSAFDVRLCPSSLDDYNIAGELTKEQLSTLLESSGVEVLAAECKPTSSSDVKFGELCYAAGEKDGYPIRVSVVAGPNPDASTDPWGRIIIGRQ